MQITTGSSPLSKSGMTYPGELVFAFSFSNGSFQHSIESHTKPASAGQACLSVVFTDSANQQACSGGGRGMICWSDK
jgi:hypothetical protein